MTQVETPESERPGIALRLLAMGVTMDARADDEETRTRLAHQWARAIATVEVPRADLVAGPLASGGEPHSQDVRDYQFTTQVTLAALQATAGERVNLHAGCVADDDGRVLVLVGPSGTGKTTATRVLAGRLRYLSDETASISPGGEVFAHPKPLSVVIDPAEPFRKEQLSPDDLGLGATPATGTLHRVVLLHRGDPGPRGLRPLDTVSALMELIEQSSSLGDLATPLTTLLELVLEAGGAHVLEYDEITEHIDELVGLLEGPSPAGARDRPVTHAHPGPPELLTPEPEGDPDDQRVRRLPWVDALEVDADLVVLLSTRAVHLNELAATLWLHLDEPRTLEDLAAWAEHVHGPHPDAVSIVRQAVAALVQESLAVAGSLT